MVWHLFGGLSVQQEQAAVLIDLDNVSVEGIEFRTANRSDEVNITTSSSASAIAWAKI